LQAEAVPAVIKNSSCCNRSDLPASHSRSNRIAQVDLATAFSGGLMQSTSAVAALVGALIAIAASTGPAAGDRDKDKVGHENVQVGPRPFYLVDKMTDGQLKRTLEQRKKGPFARTEFSIGHRGAGLQFPEHTLASYEAAIHMGAGSSSVM
jgi:hypothetical protein